MPDLRGVTRVAATVATLATVRGSIPELDEVEAKVGLEVSIYHIDIIILRFDEVASRPTERPTIFGGAFAHIFCAARRCSQ